MGAPPSLDLTSSFAAYGASPGDYLHIQRGIGAGDLYTIVSSTGSTHTIRPATWLERCRFLALRAWRWMRQLALRQWDSIVDREAR